MSEAFLGEIRIFTGNYAPSGWALCNGQILPITQNTALFSLLGVQFGGNGTSNFALPNLQGNGPMDMGAGVGLTPRTMGETGGVTTVTLTSSQMPVHNHAAQCNLSAGNSSSPAGNIWAESRVSKSALPLYSDSVQPVASMASGLLGNLGGGLAHNNLAPYLVLTFIICQAGIFPSRG